MGTLHLMSGGAAQGLVRQLQPPFEASSGLSLSGTFGAVGAMKHEISEVLGRTGSVGRAFGPNVYTSLDLFRYKAGAGSGPAVRVVTPGGANDFFSIDGGHTNLGNFNSTNGSDDYADWNAQELGDAYGFGQPGVRAETPARDLIVMAAIGYNFTARGLAAGHEAARAQHHGRELLGRDVERYQAHIGELLYRVGRVEGGADLAVAAALEADGTRPRSLAQASVQTSSNAKRGLRANTFE